MMRNVTYLFAIAALAASIAGCSTDGLTPQAEIPDGTQTTQAMPESGDQGTGQSDTAQLPMIDGEPQQTYDRAPQNTLEAQAQALERGEENPSLTKAKPPGSFGSDLYRSDTETRKVASLYSAQPTKGSIRFL